MLTCQKDMHKKNSEISFEGLCGRLTVPSVPVRAGVSVVYRGSGHRLWEMGLRWRWTGGCRTWLGKEPLL